MLLGYAYNPLQARERKKKTEKMKNRQDQYKARKPEHRSDVTQTTVQTEGDIPFKNKEIEMQIIIQDAGAQEWMTRGTFF